MAWPWAAGEPITAGGLNSLYRFARRTSDSAPITNSNTPVDDTQLQLNGLPTNTVFALTSYIVYGSTAAADLTYVFSIPAGATFSHVPAGIPVGVTTSEGILRMPETGNFNRTLGGVDSTNMVMFPSGILITGATLGDFRFRWAQGTATAGVNTFVRAGSWIMLTKVGTV